MGKDAQSAELACSFCGKKNSEVAKLIAGPSILICNECVARCARIAHEGVDVPQLTPAPVCNFCGETRHVRVHPPSTLGRHELICTQCLDLCERLISGRL